MKKYSLELVGKLKDGTPIIISDFIKGGDVWTIDANGTKSPIPDGDQELEDGTKFVTKDGKIDSIMDSSQSPEDVVSTQTATPSPATPPTLPVTQEVKIPVAQEVNVSIDTTQLEKMTKELVEKITSLETKLMTEIEKKFNSILPDSTLVKANKNQESKVVDIPRREQILNIFKEIKENY